MPFTIGPGFIWIRDGTPGGSILSHAVHFVGTNVSLTSDGAVVGMDDCMKAGHESKVLRQYVTPVTNEAFATTPRYSVVRTPTLNAKMVFRRIKHFSGYTVAGTRRYTRDAPPIGRLINAATLRFLLTAVTRGRVNARRNGRPPCSVGIALNVGGGSAVVTDPRANHVPNAESGLLMSFHGSRPRTPRERGGEARPPNGRSIVA